MIVNSAYDPETLCKKCLEVQVQVQLQIQMIR